MYCVCDFPADFVTEKLVSARKLHTCCECGHKIQPPERYVRITGKWDGQMDRFTRCERCSDLAESLNQVTCVEYNGLQENYQYYLEDQPCHPTKSASEIVDEVFLRHRRWPWPDHYFDQNGKLKEYWT